MSISKEKVEHIARLAQITLSRDETEQFGHELSAVLNFVEKLNEVDTGGVPSMSGGTQLNNVTREDEQPKEHLEGESEKLIESSPDTHRGYIKVKAVFESP